MSFSDFIIDFNEFYIYVQSLPLYFLFFKFIWFDVVQRDKQKIILRTKIVSARVSMKISTIKGKNIILNFSILDVKTVTWKGVNFWREKKNSAKANKNWVKSWFFQVGVVGGFFNQVMDE